MSLDLWMEKPACPTCKHTDDRDAFNHTYNCAPMWREVYPDAKNMVDIDGMTGKESLPKLKHAIREMNRHSVKFIALNPPNGWGSYESFFKFLLDLVCEAEKYPDLIWRACR